MKTDLTIIFTVLGILAAMLYVSHMGMMGW